MKPNYEDDIAPPSNEALKEISDLAGLQLRQQAEVDKLTEQLKTATDKLRKTQEKDLPETMKAAGMEKFTTTESVSIEISETLYASISKKNKPAAIKWLMKNGQSSLVKEDVIVLFDKGDHKKAEKLFMQLKKKNYPVVTNENINTGSVKSVIKEFLEQGEEVPLEIFGAYFHRKAVITK